jgi:hypothetical protein
MSGTEKVNELQDRQACVFVKIEQKDPASEPVSVQASEQQA